MAGKQGLRSPVTLALIGLAFTNLFWASNAVIARFASSEIPPFTLAFARWLIALLILLPFALPQLKGKWIIVRQQWRVILLLGFLGIAIYNTFLYLAAHQTTAVNITLVSSSMPLIMLLMSYVLLRNIPSRWQWGGIFISLIGVFIIILKGELSTLVDLSFNRGDIIIFLIACVWSVYSIVLRKYPVALPSIALLWVFTLAGVPIIFLLACLEWLLLPAIEIFSTQNVAIGVYVAIFPSILSYLLWGYSVKTVGPNIAALSTYLMPLFTALIAIPLLGERLYSYHLSGGILILIGLYFGVMFKQKKA